MVAIEIGCKFIPRRAGCYCFAQAVTELSKVILKQDDGWLHVWTIRGKQTLYTYCAYDSSVAKSARTFFDAYSSTTSDSDNGDTSDRTSYDSGLVIRI